MFDENKINDKAYNAKDKKLTVRKNRERINELSLNMALILF